MSSSVIVVKDDNDGRVVSPIVLEFVLMDISDIVSEKRHKMTMVEEQMCMDKVKQSLHQCQEAIPIIRNQNQQQSNNQLLKDSMITKIKRYYWLSDKYLSLSSVLFKSWVYYYYYYYYYYSTRENYADTQIDFHHNSVDRNLTVMIVPCTKAKKPFIPSETYHPNDTLSSSQSQTNDPFPFNISHEYPFIGLVYHKLLQSNKPSSLSYFQLGLDIVSFDPPKPNLYGNTTSTTTTTNMMDEFLQMFQSSFTSWEMERIKVNYYAATRRTMDDPTMRISLFRKRRSTKYVKLRCQESSLKEFYLRWSMKEAYTKAIGLGMGIPFESFEIHLLDIDDTNTTTIANNNNNNNNNNNDNDGDDSGIWSYIMKKQKTMTTMMDSTNNNTCSSQNTTFHAIRGIVKNITNKNDSQNDVMWNFFFIPLSYSSTKQYDYKGCACICMGPLQLENNNTDHNNPHMSTLVTMQTISFETLSNWHKKLH